MYKGLIGKVSLSLIGLAILAEVLAVFRPLPALRPNGQLSIQIPAQTVTLAWPSTGQSALGAQGFGLLASNGAQSPAPIASVAKVITALAVLKQHPLLPNQQGPVITLGQVDVDNYQTALGEDGSVVPVAVGEQISERQALEAMLLPSANNMATSLAEWAFGSLDSYTNFANSYVKTLGLKQTTISDASGFSPSTVSTANDLVALALAAMANPTLAAIVGETQATVPVAGTVQNTNWLIGTNGIVGIKTGNTDQAGGCFMFAARHNLFGQSVLIVGVVMNAPTLSQAIDQANTLVLSADSGFSLRQPVLENQVVGTYTSSWGAKVNAISGTGLSVLTWKGQAMSVSARLNKLASNAKKSTPVGTITAKSNKRLMTTTAISQIAVGEPSLSWRLLHP